jgi:hypothetical protein
MLPVLPSLAGIQLLDHGAPPQHKLNGCSTVLLLNLFLQQLARVAALKRLSNTTTCSEPVHRISPCAPGAHAM